jgi:transposase
MKEQFTNKIDLTGESIYVGIDVHKKQWNVSIMGSLKEHKTFVQPPDAYLLVNYLHQNFPNADYFSVYEAGFSGFWAHDQLVQAGIKNLVVSPSDVPTTDKEKRQKRDSVDSRKLCRSLREGSLRGIYTPSREELEDRGLVRLRKKLVIDITRCKNRIKGQLNYYGVKVPSGLESSDWSKGFIKWLEEINWSHPSGSFAMKILLLELENVKQSKRSLEKELIKMSKENMRIR